MLRNLQILFFISTVVFGLYYLFYLKEEKIINLVITNSEIKIIRKEGGVPKIFSEKYEGFFKIKIGVLKGLGYMHARDRLLQIYLVKFIGEGRLSEFTQATEENKKIDIFMRRQNFHKDSLETKKYLSKETIHYLNNYLEGLNYYINENSLPFELKLINYKIENYTIEDSIRLFKLMAYAGLGETQEEMER
jgi:penicillin amidase